MPDSAPLDTLDTEEREIEETEDTDAYLLEWSAPEHPHTEKSRDWYWALGVITISTALISLLLSNVLFALLIVLAGFTIGMSAARAPKEVLFRLTEDGLVIDGDLYPFESMRGYAIDEERNVLLIDTPRVMTPDIVVPIPDSAIPGMRTVLTAHNVPIAQLSEPLPYRILEFFGF